MQRRDLITEKREVRKYLAKLKTPSDSPRKSGGKVATVRLARTWGQVLTKFIGEARVTQRATGPSGLRQCAVKLLLPLITNRTNRTEHAAARFLAYFDSKQWLLRCRFSRPIT